LGGVMLERLAELFYEDRRAAAMRIRNHRAAGAANALDVCSLLIRAKGVYGCVCLIQWANVVRTSCAAGRGRGCLSAHGSRVNELRGIRSLDAPVDRMLRVISFEQLWKIPQPRTAALVRARGPKAVAKTAGRQPGTPSGNSQAFWPKPSIFAL
jgi:hypothetical protein